MHSQTTETEGERQLRSPPSGVSCKKCAHIVVCTMFRAIAPLLESLGKEKPFQAEDLAKICKHFLSQAIVSSING